MIAVNCISAPELAGELVAARNAIIAAPATDKLRTIEREATRLGRFDDLSSGDIRSNLYTAAEASGVVAQHDAATVWHVINQGVTGQTAFAEAAAAEWTEPDWSLLDDRRGA